MLSSGSNTELNRTLEDLYPYWHHTENKPWIDVENMDDCQKLFEDFKRVSRDHTGYRDFGEQTTEEFVSKIFINGTYNYSTNTNHTKCVAMETEVLQLIEEPLVEAKMVWEIYLNLTTADTIQEALVYAERLTGYYGDIVDNGLIRHKYYQKMYNQCNWITKFISRQLIRVGWYKLTEGREIRKNVRKILDIIRREYRKMYENYMTMILLKIENLDRYLHGNMTKAELSGNLSETSFARSVDALYGRNTDILSSIKEYATEMTLAKENILGFYSVLVSLKVPILNTHNVYELKLVKQSDTLNDSRLQEIVDSLRSNVTYLPELVAKCYNRLIESMDELTDGPVKPIKDMLKQLDELRNDLEIYQTSTRMDTDFFM